MAEIIEQKLAGKIEDLDKYVHELYDKQIDWYWNSSKFNRKNYKRYRYWTTVLGALVTVIASLATAEFVRSNTVLDRIFTLATPALAATLTIISGLSQNFQWGATWRDMVVNDQLLQRERDRFLSTDPKDRKYQEELNRINEIMLEETHTFFQRVLDSEVVPAKSSP